MPQTIEAFLEQNPSPPDDPGGMPIEQWNSLNPEESGFENGVFKVDPENVKAWKERGPIGFFEAWNRQDKTEMLPYNPEAAIKSYSVLTAVNRLKDGKYKDTTHKERDELKVGNFLMGMEEERVRGVTIPGQIARGASMLPGFMIEFISSGGLATMTKFAAKKGLMGLAKRTVARTALQPHRIAEGFTDRQTQASLDLTDKGIEIAKQSAESPITSAMKSVGDVFIENLSEESGAIFGKVASKIIPKGLTKSMEKVFARLHPNEAVSKLWTKAGYHGFLSELGEERIGDLMRAVTGVDDFGADNPHNVMDRVVSSLPNWEQLLVEAGTLAIPGLGGAAVSQSLNALQKLKGKAKAPDTTIEIDDATADRLAAQTTDTGEMKPMELDYPEELLQQDKEYADARIQELQGLEQTPEVVQEIEQLQGLSGVRFQKKESSHDFSEQIKEFGLTKDVREAGYLLPDGRMLDLSGKNQGGTPGQRSLDHREVGGTDSMQEMIANGAVRMSNIGDSAFFDMSKEPSEQQYKTIEDIIRKTKGSVTVDLDYGLGEKDEGNAYYRPTKKAFSYQPEENTSAEIITDNIRKYFKKKGAVRFQKSPGGKIDKKAAKEQLDKLLNLIPESYRIRFEDTHSNDYNAFADTVKKLVVFTKNIKENTVPHEAFHVAFTEGLSKQGRSDLISEVKRLHNDRFLEKLDMEGNPDIAAEEVLADMFAEEWLGRQAQTTGEKIKQFIKDTLAMIRSFGSNSASIAKTLADLSTGKVDVRGGEGGVRYQRYRSDLLKFIKNRGGLTYEGMKGEVKMFLGKDSGYVGLVSKKGISVDRMAEAVREAIASGELDYHGPMETEADLVEAVRDELFKIKNVDVEEEGDDFEGAMMARLESLPEEERKAEEESAKRIKKKEDDSSLEDFEKSFENFPKNATQKELIEFYKGLTPKERVKARIANMKRNQDLKSGASLPESFYARAEKESKGKAKDAVSVHARDALQFLERLAGEISTRARNINPKIEGALRRFEFSTKTALNRDLQRVNGFLKKFHDLKKSMPTDYRRLDFALKNRDAVEIKRLTEKHKMTEEYAQATDLLDEIYVKATDAGLDVGYLKDYFPRVIKDRKRMVEYFYGIEEWSYIEEFLKEKEMQIGRALTVDEKGRAIGEFLLRVRSGTMPVPANVKKRLVETITPEINKFYGDSLDSLVSYITEMNESIQTRAFFGRYANEFKSLDQVENVIGSYVLGMIKDKEISAIQEQELSEILKARFVNNRGTRGFVSLVKNMSYIETMGSFISAVTQIGDLAFTLHKNGFYRTVSAMSDILRNKQVVTRKDIGLDMPSEEFMERGNLGKAVSWVFRAVGIESIDTMGKETFLNASLARLQEVAQAPENKLKQEFQHIFGEETDQVIQDLKNKVYSNNVKMLLFSELSNIQPISLSEMPEYYLTSGNLRVFYMLKSYTIKQIDAFRREAFEKIGKPETRAEGFKNLITLSAALMLMNAGADVIKALLLGRPIDPNDLFWDNFLRLLGLTKFNIYKFKEEGITGGLASYILPPAFGFVTAIYKDVSNAFSEDPKDFGKQEIVKSVPIAGKFYYWWFGGGADKSEKKRGGGKRPRL